MVRNFPPSGVPMPRTLAVLAVCLGVATAPPAQPSHDPDTHY
jgi:hypothetical protein